jgi:hypothetical protein
MACSSCARIKNRFISREPREPLNPCGKMGCELELDRVGAAAPDK